MRTYLIKLFPVVTFIGMNHIFYQDERFRNCLKTWTNCSVLNYVPKTIKSFSIGESVPVKTKIDTSLPKN